VTANSEAASTGIERERQCWPEAAARGCPP
jgi:hypothetical protein